MEIFKAVMEAYKTKIDKLKKLKKKDTGGNLIACSICGATHNTLKKRKTDGKYFCEIHF